MMIKSKTKNEISNLQIKIQSIENNLEQKMEALNEDKEKFKSFIGIKG